MVAVAVAGLAAMLAVFGLREPLSPWAAWSALCAVLPFVRRHPVARLLLAALCAAALAATAVAARRADRLTPALDGARVELTGRVASLPDPAGRAWRFEFVPDAPPDGVPRRLRVLWYGETPPRAAERWRLALRLRAPRGLANPGGFDYEAWLFERGLGALGSATEGERVEPAAPGWLGWRAALAARIAAHCAGHRSCGVVQGLAVGHAGAIDAADWRTYRATGTLHLVAISGLHVTLLAGLAYVLARAAWARVPWLAARVPAGVAAGALALGVATCYALLAGFGVPARRTLLMLAVAFIALARRRAGAPFDTLAAAMLAVLLTDPFAARAPGFWLSFAGVAVLVVTARPGAGAWRRAARAQTAVAVGLAPVLGAAFGAVPLAAPFANALAIPAFNFVAVPATLAGLVLLPWAPGLGGGAVDLACAALERLQPLLETLAVAVPELQASGPPSPVALALCALGAALLLAPRGVPGRALAPLLALPMFLPQIAVPPPGAFHLAVLDVGQGHAAVVSTRHHTLIYDAGPAFGDGDAGDAAVVPYLRTLGRRPDVLVVSHADSDHAGGVASVRRAWPAVAVLAGEDHARIGAALPCRAGRRWTWDGVRFEVLAPSGPGGEAGGNARSCVLSVRGPAAGALLSGDLPAREERALVAAQGAALHHAVLISPHHGSAGSSSAAFVAATRARHVIHPAGHLNRWGFPRPEVVARYAAAGAGQLTTGAAGAVLVEVAPDGGTTLHGWRAEDRRAWRQP